MTLITDELVLLAAKTRVNIFAAKHAGCCGWDKMPETLTQQELEDMREVLTTLVM